MTVDTKAEPVPEMISIPEGFFLMGSEKGQDNERPIHRVWVDRFLIGKFPVTNKDYRIFVRETGASEPPFWNDEPYSHPDKPVVGTSWLDAVAYCEWLSRRTGELCRLPTEAEWERVARGGKEGKPYPWGDASPDELSYLGYDAETDGPQVVGCDEGNGFGICDMSGGVHEWCSDYYEAAYYECSPERNPQGPASGKRRASRGGSWRHRVKFSRCAARSSLDPSFHYADYGFRVAKSF